MISKIIYKMIEYFGNDVRRISHALKVYGYTKTIAGLENLQKSEQLVAEIAAVLHDIGIRQSELKYHSSAAGYQEAEGPSVAAELLDGIVESAVTERVCYIIGNHHSYKKIDGTDFQILVEADFLVNIEEEHKDSRAINAINEKYFKTASGIKLLNNIYK